MDTHGIRMGMRVRTPEGKPLGKVVALGRDTFLVESGFFAPHTARARYECLRHIDHGEAVVDSEAWLIPLEEAGAPAPVVRMPLAEEELVTRSTLKDAGGVRITKEVVTEMQTLTVPVRKERLRVERIEATGEVAKETAHQFENDEQVIRLYEEEIEVVKRAVVREEVRVHKDVEVEEKVVTEPVRREVATVIGEHAYEPDH